MCGIIGYISEKGEAAPVLLEGLSHLEYRGYDSAGLAVLSPNGNFRVEKAVGHLEALRQALGGVMPRGSVGIGHTRWATHGQPTMDNAHPHMDCHNQIAVVQNGIVENYLALKRELQKRGHTFSSQTDTEVLPHLIEEELARGASLEEAVRGTLAQAKGAFALLVSSSQEPETLIALRSGNAGGLVVGYGASEMFIASDLPALLPYTRRVVYLRNSDGATVTSQGARYWTLQGEPFHRKPQTIAQDPVSAAKEGYKHFMLKEIFQQPEVMTNAFHGRVDLESRALYLEELEGLAERLRSITRVVLTGCGTSLHAAMVGQRYIERIARIPAEVEVASELRYRDILLGPETLVVSVAQSGETADTLAAMEGARETGALQVTLANVMESQSTRIADATLPLRAGIEVGVAATKTFMASMMTLYLLALHLGLLRGSLSADRFQGLLQDLTRLPHLAGELLLRAPAYEELAQRFYKAQHFLYLGRGNTYPIALEGALKLKEISYIHAEGYPGGEMKHGPIALIDENLPVVAIALRDNLYEKMAGNIEEVKARNGTVIALVSEGDTELPQRVDHVIPVPALSGALSPLLATVPLQLFAYYVAVLRGADVDQPRNLAKSVTVE